MAAGRGLVSTALLTAIALCDGVGAQPLDLTADFSARGRVEAAYAANALLSCDTTEPTCRGVRRGVVAGSNGDMDLRYVDVDPPRLGDLDADGRDDTINSSGAMLELPEGARVEFARLYVGGIWQVDNDDLCGEPRRIDEDERLSVRLAPPGSDDYLALRGALLGEDRQAVGSGYAAMFDVTEHITGPGEVWVADAGLVEGRCAAGGWALAVAYRTDDGPPRTVTLLSGYAPVAEDVTARASAEVLAPPAGPVGATIALGVVEGDRGLDADGAALGGRALGDAANPADDLFNSSISRGGANVEPRTPSHVNNLGYDFDVLDAGGRLDADARTATVEISAQRDFVRAFFVGISVDLAVPRADFAHRARALAGAPEGPVAVGDRIEYVLEFAADPENNDPIAGAVLDDPLPIEVAWVDGSFETQRGDDPFAPAADGSAEYDPEAHRVTGRLDAPLAPGEVWRLRFELDVLPSAGQPIENSATIRWWGEAAGPEIEREARSDSDPAVAGDQPSAIAARPPADGGVDAAPVDAAPADAAPIDAAPADAAPTDAAPTDIGADADTDSDADAGPDETGLLAEGEELAGGNIFGCATDPGLPSNGWLVLFLPLALALRRRPAVAMLALAPLLATGPGHAAERFDVQSFAPASDLRHHGLRLLSARPRPGPRWSTGLLLDHADDPLVVEAGGSRTRSLVARQTRAHLVTNAAFHERVDLGFVVPVMLDADGDGAARGPGLGDMRIQGRVVVWHPGQDPPTAIAVALDAYMGTGDGRAFHGDPGLRFETRVLASHRLGDIDLRANLGWHARDPARLGNLEVTDALTVGLGAEIPLTGPWSLLPELDAAVGLADDLDPAELPVEAIIAARWKPDPAWSALAGLGAGLAPGAGAPDWRAVIGFGYTRPLDAPPKASDAQSGGSSRARQPSRASRFAASSGSR